MSLQPGFTISVKMLSCVHLNPLVDQAVARPAIKSCKIASFINSCQICNAADIDKNKRKVVHSCQLFCQCRMIGRDKRRYITAMPHVIAAHNINYVYAGFLRKQCPVADLDCHMLLRTVQHSLAMKSD